MMNFLVFFVKSMLKNQQVGKEKHSNLRYVVTMFYFKLMVILNFYFSNFNNNIFLI